MTRPGPRERIFASGETRSLPGLDPCDVAALSTADHRDCGNAIRSAGDGDVRVWRIGAPTPTLLTAYADDRLIAAGRIAKVPGVLACGVYLTASRPERRGLIVCFGHHLATLRAADGSPEATAVLVADTAEVPEGENLVAIPHLVATTTEAGIEDAIVWEWAGPALLGGWRRGRLFDLGTWQSKVGPLVRLKGALRRGAVDRVRQAELLRRLEGRYLSFRFVVENEELVAAALDDVDLVDRAGPLGP